VVPVLNDPGDLAVADVVQDRCLRPELLKLQSAYLAASVWVGEHDDALAV
jgi:hypothetical protein